MIETTNSLNQIVSVTHQPDLAMTDDKTWQAEVIGSSPNVRYLRERLQLDGRIRLIISGDLKSSEHQAVNILNRSPIDGGESAWSTIGVDATIFADGFTAEQVSSALRSGRHVVVDRPWQLTSTQLQQLHQQATTLQKIGSIFCLRRWSADFMQASTAVHSQRLGSLQHLNFVTYEQSVSNDLKSGSVLREFGYNWFDQLLVLVQASPVSVFGKIQGHASRDSGFLALIEFDNGCLARIDVNTESRLGFRMGWMLEGSLGSYRNDKLYTNGHDGEIIDEPLKRTPRSNDPFLDELTGAWQGHATLLPTLADGARVMRLIEAIEMSNASGLVVSNLKT